MHVLYCTEKQILLAEQKQPAAFRDRVRSVIPGAGGIHGNRIRKSPSDREKGRGAYCRMKTLKEKNIDLIAELRATNVPDTRSMKILLYAQAARSDKQIGLYEEYLQIGRAHV